MDIWLTWLIVGLALIGFEMITPGFVIAWFGVGALAASLTAYFGLSITLQLLAFITVSVVLLGLSRQFAARLKGGQVDLKTNYDALVGQRAIVTQTIVASTGLGVVKVIGEEWSALAETEQDIPSGDKVEVVAVQGVRLVVRPLVHNSNTKEEEV